MGVPFTPSETHPAWLFLILEDHTESEMQRRRPIKCGSWYIMKFRASNDPLTNAIIYNDYRVNADRVDSQFLTNLKSAPEGMLHKEKQPEFLKFRYRISQFVPYRLRVIWRDDPDGEL